MNFNIMRTAIFMLFALDANLGISQIMPLPLQTSIEKRVYMSTSGNDSNVGDSLNPVASFTQALTRLNQLSNAQIGDVFAEVVLFEGTYSQALSQAYSMYQIGSKKLNVSVRGIGVVQLDGLPVSNISSGGGMIHLLGSRISVRNIEILYSPANGVRFGYDYNGIEVNSHDIIVKDVVVSSTLGHGILVGKGALNTINPLSITAMAERFLVENCEVKNAVNYNIPQAQWGSAIKAWNAKHVNIRNCRVHDNSGEGIDFDYCDSVAVYGNTLKDNYANIYFDKVTNGWMYNNLIENELKQSPGILCAIEAFTGLILNYYIGNVNIFNNVLLNTQGLHFWQGNYGANQHGYFQNIAISHNTIIGHQTGSGSCLHFNYLTFLGQPVPNVSFQNIHVSRNIISAPIDSLNNGQLCFSSISPQVGLTASNNLYNSTQVPWYNATTDVVINQLPNFAASLAEVTPSLTNPLFVSIAPISTILFDHLFLPRLQPNTNLGALEFDQGNAGIIPLMSLDKQLYPNPSSGEIHLPKELAATWVNVLNKNGQLVMKMEVGTDSKLSLNDLPNATYFLQTSKQVFRLVVMNP